LQSVAAKLPLELWERLEKRFALPLANHYGLTETVASAIYSGPHSEMGPIGTLGVPIDCDARIDPAATSATGDDGELQLRGANIFSGYWKDEKRSRASFTDDGWLRTGDLARQNPDGSYSITGRIKNIIMSGGFLIRPEEIDETMLSHPQICESVTVAVPDEVFGEIPATAVVLYADDALSTEGLTEHARSSLEARKVPKRFLILESIPRGISGKPKLQELASMFGTEPAGSSAASDAQTDLLTSVLELAASIFRVPAEDLSAATHPGDVKGWDSFSHVALILEAEAQFSVRLPASKVAKIASIRDLCDAIEEQV
jgi:acyl-CoA synthetase (AMP-forming)/AMP-acid ligase II/acyl carrier protein